jgi:hypothetical protein
LLEMVIDYEDGVSTEFGGFLPEFVVDLLP